MDNQNETEVVAPTTPQAEEQKEQALALLEARKLYLHDDRVRDFGQFPIVQKLAVCQKIEKGFIKRRKVGGAMIPYLPHQTAEKILNFIFNFKVSNEVIRMECEESTQAVSKQDAQGEYSKTNKKTYDAFALVKFTFTYPDGEQIIRTVLGTHKSFENPATSKHEAMKSAISKSWTVVARTFGIGTELEQKEEEAAGRSYKKHPQAQEKNFGGMDY
jgi:hypothetical protein